MPRFFSGLLLALCCLLSSCGGDSHEAVAADTVSIMNELTEALKGATDADSARAAKPELEEIIAEMKALDARMKELGELDKEEEERIGKEVGIEAAATELMKEAVRVSMDQEVVAILQPVLNEMQSIGGR